MSLPKLNQPGARGARTLVTLRAHLGEAASSAVVATPAVVPTLRPVAPWWRRRHKPRKSGICCWPESERPREKLFAQGKDALSEAELVALLLGSGTRGHSAVDVARSLIQEFGSLREMLNADQERWKRRPGIGPAKYGVLLAAMEIARRCLKEPLRETSALATPDATRKFLLAQLQDRHREVVCCIFLNNGHRMLGFEEVAKGTIDGATVPFREIVLRALHYSAASVIMAHNHPSGAVEPSMADEEVTRRLRHALSLIDVRLVDHFVVADGKCYSFSEHGLL